jgi:predicted DNA-binding transcriptional regulator AlpA
MENKQHKANEPLLVDWREACEMLNIGKNRFFTLRATGQLPIKKIQLGGSVRYRRKEIIDWVENGCPENWKGGAR